MQGQIGRAARTHAGSGSCPWTPRRRCTSIQPRNSPEWHSSCACKHKCIRMTYENTHANTYTRVCLPACTRARTQHTSVHTHERARARTRTHTHTYTHNTHIQHTHKHTHVAGLQKASICCQLCPSTATRLTIDYSFDVDTRVSDIHQTPSHTLELNHELWTTYQLLITPQIY